MDVPPTDRAPAFSTLAAREPITSLRFFGRALPALALWVTRHAFTIGAGACDLVVPLELSATVAPLHATIEREGSGLRVRDEHTTHGVYRALRGARVSGLRVEAGDVFWLGSVAFVAMEPHLDELRARLGWFVGFDRHVAIDDAIEAVAEGRPLVLVGPQGSDAIGLARAIHAAGAQRFNGLAIASDGAGPVGSVADDSTICVDLDRVRHVSAPRLLRMFDPQHGVRAIFTASSERAVRAVLDSYRDRARTIAIPALAQRRDEIGRLIATCWRDELRSARSVDELGARAIQSIATYAWPHNLDELRAHAARLLAFVEHGSVRRAAAALGIKHQSLSGHFARIGFPVPNAADRDAAWLRRDGGMS